MIHWLIHRVFEAARTPRGRILAAMLIGAVVGLAMAVKLRNEIGSATEVVLLAAACSAMGLVASLLLTLNDRMKAGKGRKTAPQTPATTSHYPALPPRTRPGAGPGRTDAGKKAAGA